MITNDINDLIEAAKAVVESMRASVFIDDNHDQIHLPPDRESCAALESALAKVVGK